MSQPEDTQGPIIVWEDYGYEGWRPKSYPTLKAALSDQRFNSSFVVTKSVQFDMVESETLDRPSQITTDQAGS